MHQAVDDAGFGNFADSPGSERTYRSWSAYLEDFFGLHADFVQRLGIDDDRIRAARAFIQSCPFVAARLLHGDVTIRNVGVYGDRPITVGLFDPNPLSGDPSWDIAPMMKVHRYSPRRESNERHEHIPGWQSVRLRPSHGARFGGCQPPRGTPCSPTGQPDHQQQLFASAQHRRFLDMTTR
jgi:fructosamine-3-kinase